MEPASRLSGALAECCHDGDVRGEAIRRNNLELLATVFTCRTRPARRRSVGWPTSGNCCGPHPRYGENLSEIEAICANLQALFTQMTALENRERCIPCTVSVGTQGRGGPDPELFVRVSEQGLVLRAVLRSTNTVRGPTAAGWLPVAATPAMDDAGAFDHRRTSECE